MREENIIKYGDYIFQGDGIKNGNVFMAVSLLSSQLQVNTLEATVTCEDPEILNFVRNTPAYYFRGDTQIAIFRMQDIERIAPKLYKLFATSTLGLLTEGQHYGGIYAGETAESVIRSICGSLPVEVKSNFRKIKLYGWLPVASPRDNLAQVLFAIGAALKTDQDGVLVVDTLDDTMGHTVGAGKLYEEGSVKYEAMVTSVVVTEHQYIVGSEERKLFEGSALEGDIVTFSEPMHSLTASGFTILESGANWARLSAGSGVLQGLTYIHSTREVALNVTDGQEPNIKTAKDATLVSLVNSMAVAHRMANYYQWRETIDAPVVYQGELPGEQMTVFHPFDRVNVAACLESADINLSGVLKAQEKLLVGFVPEQIEDFETLNTQKVFLADGEFVVPEGVTYIRVVVIGGGHGGDSGGGGASGTSGGAGGKGGIAGAGGVGGNIYQFSLEVTPGDKFAVVIGKGGAGGKPSQNKYDVSWFNSNPGSPGTDSSFGNHSSSSGEPSNLGYVDLLSNTVYGQSGSNGVAGGTGGKSGSSGDGYGGAGESVRDPVSGRYYNGGLGGNPSHNGPAVGNGAGGGGAAVGGAGSRGGNGSAAYSNVISTGAVIWASARGGDGGDGAWASNIAKSTQRGGGGPGGNGGGGSGAGGAASGGKVDPSSGNGGNFPGTPGAPGYGAAGAAGGDGVVIVYYRSDEGGGGEEPDDPPVFQPFQGRIKFQTAAIYAVGEPPYGDIIGEYKMGDIVTVTELNSYGNMAHVERGWIPSNAYTKIET